VLIVHFFSTAAPEAADEMRGLFGFQRGIPSDGRVEFVLIAQDRDLKTVDDWLAKNGLQPPAPDEIVLDADGDTTRKLNSKRPLETMFFNAEGKLSSQARGRLDWLDAAAGHLSQALGGGTIE
jgi:hypothetical protein